VYLWQWSFSREKFVVIICSTTGEGEPPETVNKFWRRIKKTTLSTTHLSHISYSLLGTVLNWQIILKLLLRFGCYMSQLMDIQYAGGSKEVGVIWPIGPAPLDGACLEACTGIRPRSRLVNKFTADLAQIAA